MNAAAPFGAYRSFILNVISGTWTYSFETGHESLVDATAIANGQSYRDGLTGTSAAGSARQTIVINSPEPTMNRTVRTA